MSGGRGWVWTWRIGGGAFVAVLVAGGTLAAITQFFVRDEHTTRNFADPMTTLRVSTDTGSITVHRASAGAPARVTGDRHTAFRPTRASYRVVGTELVVDTGCEGFWPFNDPCHVDVDVAVPAGVAVDLRSATGDLAVEGVAAEVTAHSTDGDIRLTGVTADAVTARTATGSLDLGFAGAPGRVLAASATGSVTITVPDDGTRYRLQIDNRTGRSEVSAPEDPASPHTLTVAAPYGNVTIRTAS